MNVSTVEVVVRRRSQGARIASRATKLRRSQIPVSEFISLARLNAGIATLVPATEL